MKNNETSSDGTTSSPVPVNFKTWLAALDADQEIPSSTQHTMLRFGLMIGFKSDGRGFFSMEQLSVAVSSSYSTVQRHVRWALANGWLVRTSRGRGGGPASTYQLHLPVGLQVIAVTDTPTGQNEGATGQNEGATGHLGDLSSSSALSEALAKDRDESVDDAYAPPPVTLRSHDAKRVMEKLGKTEEEAEKWIEGLRAREYRHWPSYFNGALKRAVADKHTKKEATAKNIVAAPSDEDWNW